MARTSRAEKARTRRRLIAAASRELRARGVAGTSIPTVMEQIGLTQGTFYSHFASKDDLLAESIGAGLAEAVELILGAQASAPAARDLAAIIARYLDPRHRDDPAGGCVLPALAGDVRRESDAVRAAFTGEFARFVARLAPLLPAERDEARTDQALSLIVGLAGAIFLARAVDDPALSDRILRASRAHYTAAFVAAPRDTPPKTSQCRPTRSIPPCHMNAKETGLGTARRE